MPHLARFLPLVILAAALGVALVACGERGFAAQEAAQRVAIATAADGLRWDREVYRARAGDVTFVVENVSTGPHRFTVEGHGVKARSGALRGGSTRTFTLRSLEPGEYRIVCNHAGHRAGGMVATLIVS